MNEYNFELFIKAIECIICILKNDTSPKTRLQLEEVINKTLGGIDSGFLIYLLQELDLIEFHKSNFTVQFTQKGKEFTSFENLQNKNEYLKILELTLNKRA